MYEQQLLRKKSPQSKILSKTTKLPEYPKMFLRGGDSYLKGKLSARGHAGKRSLISFLFALSIIIGMFPIPALAFNVHDIKGDTGHYITEGLGFSRDNLVEWLRSHEKDTYYLGTPYKGLHATGNLPRPNGDHGTYSPGMQCNGFVAHAIEAVDGKVYSTLAPYHHSWFNTDSWVNYCIDKGYSVEKFDTKADMLASGKLQKGDIIICNPLDYYRDTKIDKYGNVRDGHMGFFWGDTPSDDKYWHSTHKTNEISGVGQINTNGNQLGAIVPKSDSYFIVIYLGPRNGKISLQKHSSNPELTDANSSYSLAGAHYGIFSDKACNNKAGEISTDINGRGVSQSLPPQTYWVKEESAPQGYTLDKNVYEVVVRPGDTVFIGDNKTVEDTPQHNPCEILIAKIDTETKKASPQGGSTLEGAEFTVKFWQSQNADTNKSPDKTWIFATDTEGKIKLSDEYKVSGDDLYYILRDGKTIPTIPLGTISIQETKAPYGYLLGNSAKEPYIQKIKPHKDVETVRDFVVYQEKEEVIRGDFSFVKAESISGSRLSHIVFKLTSQTTGESHLIVTDKNGSFDSSTYSQSQRTNANDAALLEDGTLDETKLDSSFGIWFGSSSTSDQRGSLPFDDYLVEELRCAANKDKELVSFTLHITQDRKNVFMGTVDNTNKPQPKNPSIKTTAFDLVDGDKLLDAHNDIKIVDKVRYQGLIPGKKYTLVATLIDKISMQALKKDGQDIVVKHPFTPVEQEGSEDVKIELDSTAYSGSEIVVFEKLFDADGNLIAEHADINDSHQTLTIKEEKEKPSPIPKTGEILSMGILGTIVATGSVCLIFGLLKRRNGQRIK